MAEAISEESIALAIKELQLNSSSEARSESPLKSNIELLNRYRKVLIQVGIRKNWKLSQVINMLALKDEDKVADNDSEIPIIEIQKILCDFDIPSKIENAWKSILQYFLVTLSNAISETDTDAIYKDFVLMYECLVYYLNNAEVFDLKSKISNLTAELLKHFVLMLKENNMFDVFKSKIHIINLIKMIVVKLGILPSLLVEVSAVISKEIVSFIEHFFTLKNEEQNRHLVHSLYFTVYLEIMNEIYSGCYSNKSMKKDKELQEALANMHSSKNVNLTAKFFINRLSRALA